MLWVEPVLKKLKFSDGFVSQLVTAFVFGVPIVAFHPYPGDGVALAQLMKLLPKFLVFYWLA